MEYNDTNVVNLVEYSYHVAAENMHGSGSNSTTVLAIPMALILPGAPIDFEVTAGDSFVELSWSTPPTNNAAPPILGYNVYRVSNSVMTLLETVTSGINYTDIAVSNGKTYYYQICAFNSVGDGAATMILSATPQAKLMDSLPVGPDAVLYAGIGAIAIIVLVDVALMMHRKRR